MRVRDIMTVDLTTAAPETTLEEIATMMRADDTGAIPIIDDEAGLLGIVTDRDIVVRCIAEGDDPTSITAEDILSGSPKTIEPNADVKEAVQVMKSNQIRRLPVVEGGKLVGIVSLGDISVKGNEDAAGDALEDISQGVKAAAGNRQAQIGKRSGKGGQQGKSGQSAQPLKGASPGGTARFAQGGDQPGGPNDGFDLYADDEDESARPSGRRAALAGADREERMGSERAARPQQDPSNEDDEHIAPSVSRASRRTNVRGGDATDRLSLQKGRGQGITNQSAGEEKKRNERVVPIRDEAKSAERRPGTKKAGSAQERVHQGNKQEQTRQTGASRSGVKTADFSKGGRRPKRAS